MLRILTIVGLALSLALAASAAGAPAAEAAPSVAAYRGLGAWIDIYDPVSWNNPHAAVERAHRRGVRTLYVETANFHAPSAIYRPDKLATLIHAAHARGMKVVAWYLPGFKDLAKDTRRCRAAIRYRTPRGQRFDSFALDIEASIVKPASLRSSRLITLSGRLRDTVGPRYPLGAIIPSPVGMTMHASYWPGFPYQRLPEFYDVIVPMGYYTYHVQGYVKTYGESRENIRLVREKTGRPSVPIHLIGGLAAQSSGNETKAFVRATREAGIIGASLYDLATSDAADWEQLRNVRTNPRQAVVLPRLDAWELPLGRLPGGDRTHPKEVFYETGPVAAGSRLEYQAFDWQRSEVRLLVNWQDLGRLPEGPAGDWSEPRTVELPAAVLNATGRNVIGFVARGSYPLWTTWGVREVQIVAP
jgi:hypothetical protein